MSEIGCLRQSWQTGHLSRLYLSPPLALWQLGCWIGSAEQEGRMDVYFSAWRNLSNTLEMMSFYSPIYILLFFPSLMQLWCRCQFTSQIWSTVIKLVLLNGKEHKWRNFDWSGRFKQLSEDQQAHSVSANWRAMRCCNSKEKRKSSCYVWKLDSEMEKDVRRGTGE